ncbi:retron Eco8 family effector endonuclease [Virgibacillus natechei]
MYNRFYPHLPSNFFITGMLSRIKRIAISHLERKRGFGYKLNPIFKRIKTICEEYCDINDTIKITLNQDKNGLQEWNIPYNVRTVLKNIFPLYFSQTRHLDLINWDEIWGILGELSKVGLASNFSLKEELEESFKNAFGDRYSKILNYIKNELESNDLEIKKFNSNEQFSNIYQLQLGGNSFKHKFNDLEYFSDGINSFNYLKLLINLVSKISDMKIKEPTIIIDEPEIGLHPKYLDEMVEILFQKSDFINIFLTTHSSRIIRNLMVNNSKVNLYHLTMMNKYTKLNKMKGFTDKRQHNIITEEEASYYFSKKIAFVEGPTEIELFSNKNILTLFPFLKKVDFYSHDSNSVNIKTIHPVEKNISIPYLNILDLDQILKYEKKTNSFGFKKGNKFTNPLREPNFEKKEMLYYGNKRIKTYNTRKRILGLIEKSKFHFDSDWGYILGRSDYFNLLRNLIRSFSLEYNIFPVLTTIEGSLINRNNHKIVYSWLKTYNHKVSKQKIIDNIYNFKNSNAYKTTALRLVTSGKLDNLETVNEWNGKNLQNLNDSRNIVVFDNIGKVKNGKTGGWVTSFIDYFFENFINNSELTNQEKIDIFRKSFPEIYMIVNSIKAMNTK